MSINLDGIENETPPDRKILPGCLLGNTAADLTPDNYERFVKAIDGWRGSAPELVEMLHRRGLDTTISTIKRHRKGDCTCRKAGLWP